jgi:hypothetical protein
MMEFLVRDRAALCSGGPAAWSPGSGPIRTGPPRPQRATPDEPRSDATQHRDLVPQYQQLPHPVLAGLSPRIR